MTLIAQVFDPTHSAWVDSFHAGDDEVKKWVQDGTIGTRRAILDIHPHTVIRVPRPDSPPLSFRR